MVRNMAKPIGIYVHIPLCVKKCLYCDFYSVALGKFWAGEGENASSGSIRERLISALCKEIEITGKYYGQKNTHDSTEKKPVDTVFFGGGTPSLLSCREMERIITCIKENFCLMPKCEITAECNPATADLEKLKAYRQLGINRLSIGAQSFDDGVLETLGRIHNLREIITTFNNARKAGFDNVSLDLMFAIPGQTFDIWKETVHRAIGLKPEHISMYSLEFMAGTPFDEMLASGKIKETDPELDRTMYEYALKEFSGSGLNQYEISNLAKEGYCCRHNLRYWDLSEYLGIGPGAHSFMDGKRYSNVADIEKYVTCLKAAATGETAEAGRPPWEWNSDCHVNSLYDSASEYMFTGLRKNEGIKFENFEKIVGKPFEDVFPEAFKELLKYVDAGDVVVDERGIRLTQGGMNISNKIMAIFV